MTLRPARAGEAKTLSELAIKSKAKWGYDAVFMAACVGPLTVTTQMIEENICRVVEDEAGIVQGFYLLSCQSMKSELELMFVDPAYIGMGIGRILINDALDHAKNSSCVMMTAESDPNAASFYHAMGGMLAGDAPSSAIPGRKLPVYIFDLSNSLAG